jgi:hypothetical protein
MKGKMELFDTRAPPRRRAKGDDADDQPIFLRKAYMMMSSCPPEIGGWTEEGDAIVVKDMKLFAQTVIPTAYRHNNFASFVRQLNFYGFRKVKSDSLERAHWWIFRHPYFLRGQPHLISEIKRSVHFANDQAGGKEVGELKNQVSSLSDRLAALTDQVDRLTLAVNGGPLPAKESKKRKTTYTPVQAVPMQPEMNRMPSLSQFDFDYFMQLEQKGDNSQQDEDMSIVMLGGGEDEEEMMMDLSGGHQEQTQQQPDYSQAITAVRELSHILSSLTPELKERFVDKLAEVMGTQLVNSMAVDSSNNSVVLRAASASPAVSVLSSSAAAEQVLVPSVKTEPEMEMDELQSIAHMMDEHQPQQEMMQQQPMEYFLPSGSKAPAIALPLASATLGAFLSTLRALKYNVPPPANGSFAEAIAAFA